MIIGLVTEAVLIGKVDRAGWHVADILTRRLIAVEEDTPVIEIAKLLAEHKIKRVPVLHHGKLVGIVSRAGIVAVILHGYIVLRDW